MANLIFYFLWISILMRTSPFIRCSMYCIFIGTSCAEDQRMVALPSLLFEKCYGSFRSKNRINLLHVCCIACFLVHHVLRSETGSIMFSYHCNNAWGVFASVRSDQWCSFPHMSEWSHLDKTKSLSNMPHHDLLLETILSSNYSLAKVLKLSSYWNENENYLNLCKIVC